MSKITFRADDDLVDAIEGFDASKSEVMRRALRAYLDDAAARGSGSRGGSLDDALAERVDELVASAMQRHAGGPQDVNVNVTLDHPEARQAEPEAAAREDAAPELPSDASDRLSDPQERQQAPDRAAVACGGCGEPIEASHAFCPTCGEPAAVGRCECGEELRSDWAFCPGCGTRTPAADVLDRGRSDGV
jgi:predicted transcriptional regulator